MWLGGTRGSLAGLFLGAALMGLVLAQAFDAKRFAWKIVAALFVFNSIGYFAGERASIALASARTHPTIDKLVWGVCYWHRPRNGARPGILLLPGRSAGARERR
jgi:hypothetical protein